MSGVSRLQYATDIRLIRVMCSGRVDMSFVLRAFQNGMDGAFIGGCHFNECHYVTDGNYHALGMVLLLRRIMKQIGLNPGRIRLEGISAGEGIRFAEIMNEYSADLKRLGPIGKGEGLDREALEIGLEAAARIVPFARLAERERLRVSARSEKAYRDFYASEDFENLYEGLIGEKIEVARLMLLLKEKPLTTSELSGGTGLPQSEVSRLLNRSSKHGLVRYDTGLKRYALAGS